MKPLFGKVGVFGVGLLGGSVALGIKERFLAEEVHAYDQDPMALEKVLFLGVADRVHTEVGPWVGELDLGILAAPVGALAELGKALAPWAHPESLWTDVGSVKAKVVANAMCVSFFMVIRSGTGQKMNVKCGMADPLDRPPSSHGRDSGSGSLNRKRIIGCLLI